MYCIRLNYFDDNSSFPPQFIKCLYQDPMGFLIVCVLVATSTVLWLISVYSELFSSKESEIQIVYYCDEKMLPKDAWSEAEICYLQAEKRFP